MKKTISERMAVAEKYHGKNKKIPAEKAKPKTTIRPKGSIKKPGFEVKVTW
jgi:hypothetical protein